MILKIKSGLYAVLLLVIISGCQKPKPIKCPPCITWSNFCMTGPKKVIDNPDMWGFRHLDEEHTMQGWQVYFQVCKRLDYDLDNDVDLHDIAILQRHY